jgi:DNA-binding MarR family transcriptional regulator
MNASSLKSIQRFKTQKMKQHGLSGAHTNCLWRLLSSGASGMNQSELVKQEMLDPSQISRVLRELVAKEYVFQEGEAGKYRRKYFLTKEGERIAREIRDTLEEVYRYVCREIPQEDIEAFCRTFQAICRGLNHAEKEYLDE